MKLLFLTSRFPYPLEKGDKLRAYYFIKHLSQKHDIYLFAVNDKVPDSMDMNQLFPFCKAIHVEEISTFQSVKQMLNGVIGHLPFQVAYFTNNSVKKKLVEFVNTHQPDKVFCHLIRMAEYADVLPTNGILDYMDAFSKGIERLADHSVWWKRLPLKLEEQRLRKYEALVFDRFAQQLIISTQDREFINHPKRESINVIPNGVEFDYYFSQTAEKKYHLLFVGHMAYPPNIEAAIYAAKRIMPIVHQQNSAITFLIAGARPTKQVKRLETNKIIVSGWVDDIRNVFAASQIMIAPMLISIGLQNKILQAMAMKIPCVISKLANNAIGAPFDCVCVAEHPDQYAEHILFLINNPAQASQMADKAYDFVKQNFEWQSNVEKILV